MADLLAYPVSFDERSPYDFEIQKGFESELKQGKQGKKCPKGKLSRSEQPKNISKEQLELTDLKKSIRQKSIALHQMLHRTQSRTDELLKRWIEGRIIKWRRHDQSNVS